MSQTLGASARSVVFSGVIMALIEGADIILDKLMSAQQNMLIMSEDQVSITAGGLGYPMGIPGRYRLGCRRQRLLRLQWLVELRRSRLCLAAASGRRNPMKKRTESHYDADITISMPLPLLLRRSRNIHTLALRPVSLLPLHLFPNRSMATAIPSAEPISPSNTRLGWIGTGVMGRAMCSHLIRAGYTVTVFNRTLAKAQPLLDMGAHLADSPHSVASQSDVVFSIVGFPSDVRQVLLHPSTGALSGLRAGGVLVDMTTSEPSLAGEIYSAAASKHCHSVDAPVSGGDRGAKSATLAIFAGGDKTVVDRLNPLFALMGKVNYMGGTGKGQFAKLANQITIASTMVGLVEGIVYAYKAGLNVESFLNAISTGAAGSKSLDLYGARILKRDFEAGFYVNHFVKDLGICLRECQNMGLALPGLALAQQLYLSLKAHGEGNLGTQALILALERLNNVSLDSAGGSTPALA